METDAQSPDESYFLKLVTLERTIRTSYTRNHDEVVARAQFPVGWHFFSKRNIDALAKQLSRDIMGIDFAYLCPIMQWAYDSRGRALDSRGRDSETSASVDGAVQFLNGLVRKRVLTVVSGDEKSHTMAVNVFFGRDLRPYNNPYYDVSARVENTRSHTFTNPDPAADPGNMFTDVVASEQKSQEAQKSKKL